MSSNQRKEDCFYSIETYYITSVIGKAKKAIMKKARYYIAIIGGIVLSMVLSPLWPVVVCSFIVIFGTMTVAKLTSIETLLREKQKEDDSPN